MTELIGAAGLSVELKQFYSRALIERAQPNLVYLRPGYSRMDGLPVNGGKSIEWRKFDRVAATTTALTEGTPGAVTRVTVSNVQATVSQYGQYTLHSDLVATQTIDPYVANISEMYGETMAISLDTVVRDIVNAGTTIQYASTGGSRGDVSSGARMTYAEVREAVSTLKNNDVQPIVDGKFVAVIHPHTEHDLMGDSDILASMQYAGQRGPSNPLFAGTGNEWDFYGIKWHVTSRADVKTSFGLSATDVYLTTIWGRGYYGTVDFNAFPPQVIVKPVGSAGSRDPLDQEGSIGWKAAITAARLDENMAVRIEHSSTLGAEGG